MDPRSVPVLVWGNVHSGVAANAIPEAGALFGTLRIMDRAGWDRAEPLVAELIAELLAPTGVRHSLNYRRGVPPVDNDAICTDIMRTAAVAGGGPAAAVVAEQSTGAEDFAMYLDHVPGALARVGVWDGVSKQVDLHSPGFWADERALAVAVRLFVHTALGALATPRP
jgi:amidohydrolase